MGIPLYGGSVGQPGVGSSTGTLMYGLKGLLRCGLCLCGRSVKGAWREGFLAGDPGRYGKKTLEKTGVSFHRGPVWGTWSGDSSTGDFERRMKGALGMGLVSLKRLRGGGLGRELLHWGS